MWSKIEYFQLYLTNETSMNCGCGNVNSYAQSCKRAFPFHARGNARFGRDGYFF